MNILQKRNISEFDYKIIDIIKLLKFKNYKIQLKGSSSLKSQQNFGDYDFFVNIPSKIKSDDAYNTIMNILENIMKSGVYIIEIKLQTLHNKKIRWYNADDINKNIFVKYFPDVDFIKLDIVSNINNKLNDISVIYKFGLDKISSNDYISSLKNDINELKKEGRYYKVLKRLFNIYKFEGDTDKLILLTEFFNSDYGRIYKDLSNYEAIEKVANKYDDPLTKKIISYNIKELGDIKQLQKEGNIMNKVAFKIYNTL